MPSRYQYLVDYGIKTACVAIIFDSLAEYERWRRASICGFSLYSSYNAQEPRLAIVGVWGAALRH